MSARDILSTEQETHTRRSVDAVNVGSNLSGISERVKTGNTSATTALKTPESVDIAGEGEGSDGGCGRVSDEHDCEFVLT